MNTQKDVIIIGAGAAGLMAAKLLSSSGKRVIILEAEPRPGGRMHTIADSRFDQPVEAGAEFIHGNLPCTMKLLREAGIGYKQAKGEMLHVSAGRIAEEIGFGPYWEEMMQCMDALGQADITISEFLDRYFGHAKYAALRQSVQSFAEGYDLADIGRAAVLPLKKEWMHEQEEQYRIENGYGQLTAWLVDQCRQNGAPINFNSTVTRIKWQKSNVMVYTNDDRIFGARVLITTVSLGMLQANKIAFEPAIPAYMEAAKAIGFGSVLKIILQFNEPFWEKLSKTGLFFLSDETIPTWWTQLPGKSNLLTGWLGGPAATNFNSKNAEEIIKCSIESLSSIFNVAPAAVREKLQHAAVFNWNTNPHTLGGYSYNTLASDNAKRIFRTPVENTLFFAGEALYTGDAQGTVEAALQTGADVAEAILKVP